MGHGTAETSRNGTPLPDLEHLELASNHTSTTPTATTMTHQNTTESSAPPPSAPSPSTTLNFSFSRGSAPTMRVSKLPSKLSNSIVTGGDEDDSDDDREFRAVTHLEDGAIVGDSRKRQERKPLVIKPPESHGEHWLQRRLKMFRPDMVDQQPQDVDLSSIPDQIGGEAINAGLQIPLARQTSTATDEKPAQEQMAVDESQVIKSEDDLARELLLQRAADPSSVTNTTPQIIIAPRTEPLTEAEVFAHDMAHLSDAPTLETYERVPVEAFGMGILLGLGWKQGTDLRGNKMEKVKEPSKRPDFLGIGAKEEAFLRVDAASGEKISKREGLGARWNPLKKVDKVTGEVVIEEGESGRSTPWKEGSRYSSPGYESSRDRTREDDRDRRKEKSRYEVDRKKDRGYDSDRRRDREYDSDRERKRKDRGDDYEDSRRKDRGRGYREYDSDYERKRRRERENGSSHRSSRQGSPRRRDR